MKPDPVGFYFGWFGLFRTLFKCCLRPYPEEIRIGPLDLIGASCPAYLSLLLAVIPVAIELEAFREVVFRNVFLWKGVFIENEIIERVVGEINIPAIIIKSRKDELILALINIAVENAVQGFCDPGPLPVTDIDDMEIRYPILFRDEEDAGAGRIPERRVVTEAVTRYLKESILLQIVIVDLVGQPVKEMFVSMLFCLCPLGGEDDLRPVGRPAGLMIIITVKGYLDCFSGSDLQVVYIVLHILLAGEDDPLTPAVDIDLVDGIEIIHLDRFKDLTVC